MTEENQKLLREFVLKYYNEGFELGKKSAEKDLQIKYIEFYRHNNIKRILYPICWLVGHKINPIWCFCDRCNLSEVKIEKI